MLSLFSGAVFLLSMVVLAASAYRIASELRRCGDSLRAIRRRLEDAEGPTTRRLDWGDRD